MAIDPEAVGITRTPAVRGAKSPISLKGKPRANAPKKLKQGGGKRISDFSHLDGLVKGFGNRLSGSYSRLSSPKARGDKPSSIHVSRKF